MISHESAVAIYDLGNVFPRKTHLTVPKSFRKIPLPSVRLHKATVNATVIEKREGFALTSPLRTLLDLAQSPFDPERLTQITKDAIKKGLVTKETILKALAPMPKTIDPEHRLPCNSL